MKKALATIAVAAAMLMLPGCASCSREWKSIQSDVSGGMRRTVTLYSNDGEVINRWYGQIDLTTSETETMFDLNGRRVVIHGGIVVAEEIEAGDQE